MAANVKLLGQAAVQSGNGWLEPPVGKTTALLYYLACQEGWVSRDDLVYLFWPDFEEHKARQNLRNLVARLRQLDYTNNLETEPTRLRWDVDSDVATFRAALEHESSMQAAQLYQGELLQGFSLPEAPEFESWLVITRTELQDAWREAALTFARELETARRFIGATEVLGRLYQTDPFDEEVLRRYLGALHLSSQGKRALAVYDSFKEQLEIELGGEPEAVTQNLVQLIKEGKPLPSEASRASLTSHARQSGRRLPVQATPFVGREREKASLAVQLSDPSCRLLSLVAPGGMGKTRLALELATNLQDTFADGVYFAPFATVTSPDLLVATIANALNFAFFGPEEPKLQLFAYLRDKELLLVLDNLEHLLSGIGLVAELLEAAPKLKVLTTSRERLELHAEWVADLEGLSYPQSPIPPLSAPPLKSPQPPLVRGAVERSDNWEDYDAVQLFAQAARRVRADFALSERNEAVVRRICQHVEGMPLALELAASWLRVLSTQDVADELEQSMNLLESSLRDLPERHHNMHAVFEQSWQRLSTNEQTALCNLSVFHGGFDKEAAGEVADVSLPLLLALSNKSFLRREASGRFTQHPLVWQYLREKATAEADSFAETQARHAAFFAAFLQEREGLLQGPKAKAVREEIDREFANVRKAWSWAVGHRREDLLDQAHNVLSEFCFSTVHFQEAETLFSSAAEALLSRSVVHGRILCNLGDCHNWQTDYQTATEFLEESIAIFKEQGAEHDEALALSYLCLSYAYSFRPGHEVEAIARHCVTLFHKTGDIGREARARMNFAFYSQNPAERERQFQECIRLSREVEDYFTLTLELYNLALCLSETYGLYQEARRHLDEALAIARSRGIPFRLAWWLNEQGTVLRYQGRLDEAEVRHLEAREICEELGAVPRCQWQLDYALCGLGQLALLRGEFDKAKRYLDEALELNRHHPDDPLALRTLLLQTLADVALEEKRLADANELSQEALNYLDTHKGETYEHLWREVFCRHQLGEIAITKQDWAGAHEQFHQALADAEAWHLLPAALHLGLGFADLAAQQGDEKRAVKLLQLAANHPASMFETKEAAKVRLERLPKTLTDGGLEDAEARPLDEIVEMLRSSHSSSSERL